MEVVFAEFVAVLIILVILKSLYGQVGATCGFYALVYGISRVKRIRKKKVVRELIKNSIKNGDSYVGEIFDIEIMGKIAQKYFPLVKTQIVEIFGTEDIDRVLEDNYIVYPCDYNGTPHYYFLESVNKSKYIYRHGIFAFKSKMDKQRFFEEHSNLKKIPTYKWEIFYDKNNNELMKIVNQPRGGIY